MEVALALSSDAENKESLYLHFHLWYSHSVCGLRSLSVILSFMIAHLFFFTSLSSFRGVICLGGSGFVSHVLSSMLSVLQPLSLEVSA